MGFFGRRSPSANNGSRLGLFGRRKLVVVKGPKLNELYTNGVYTANGKLYTRNGLPVWRINKNTGNVSRNKPANSNLARYLYKNKQSYNSWKFEQEYKKRQEANKAARAQHNRRVQEQMAARKQRENRAHQAYLKRVEEGKKLNGNIEGLMAKGIRPQNLYSVKL